MIKNRLKALWADGQPVLNGWLCLPNSFTAEVMAEQGWDSVTVDMQHGLIGYEAMLAMLQAIRASGVAPLVRVPWLAAEPVMKALDAGAYGIICPMVNTRAEAEQLVSWARYPPLGTRSFGPLRAAVSAGANYAHEANDEIICLAMIETEEAAANIDEIASTPGIDGVYIGPADLAFSLSRGRLTPGFDREEPEVVDAIRRIVASARAHGKHAGLHTANPEYAARALEWGVDFTTVGVDVFFMAEAAAAAVTRFRGLAGAPK